MPLNQVGLGPIGLHVGPMADCSKELFRSVGRDLVQDSQDYVLLERDVIGGLLKLVEMKEESL